MVDPHGNLEACGLCRESGGHSHRAEVEGPAVVDLSCAEMANSDDRIVGCHGCVVAITHCLREAIQLKAAERICLLLPKVRRKRGDPWRPGRFRRTVGCVDIYVFAFRGKEHLSTRHNQHTPVIAGHIRVVWCGHCVERHAVEFKERRWAGIACVAGRTGGTQHFAIWHEARRSIFRFHQVAM
jgi:hypothetical protein